MGILVESNIVCFRLGAFQLIGIMILVLGVKSNIYSDAIRW